MEIMNGESLEKSAPTEFIREFFRVLEEGLSMFPARDRHVFPAFSRSPHRVIVHLSPGKGVAFEAKRTSNNWLFSKRVSRKRIEVAAGLPVREQNGFRIEARRTRISAMTFVIEPASKHYQIKGGTILVFPQGFGLLELAGDSDVQLYDFRLLFIDKKKPRFISPPFIWLFSHTASLGLNQQLAREIAEDQLTSMILSVALQVDVRRISEVTAGFLKRALNETLTEYWSLVRRTDVEEAEVQRFLASKKFILEHSAERCIDWYRFGNAFIADFVIVYPDKTYRLVEIERPHDRPVIGNGLSSRATNAISQVNDWVMWLRENPDPLLGPLRPRVHWVILGMEETMSQEEWDRLRRENERLENLEVRTFDQIGRQASKYIEDRIVKLGQGVAGTPIRVVGRDRTVKD
jgi:hypothetical protein